MAVDLLEQRSMKRGQGWRKRRNTFEVEEFVVCLNFDGDGWKKRVPK
jgi:hypothetical protein